MMFCPKCGALLVPKRNKKQTTCSCGYVHKEPVNISLSEDVKSEKEIEVLNEEDKLKTLPLTDVDCPECKHTKARFWTAQTRSADEAETRFFRCEKCHHVWRDAA
ncbi:transcription factor S [Candidatus Woesearchaeota archaeon]|nr:transcription factor S [Candidatus Woesearchaeota archaeon]